MNLNCGLVCQFLKEEIVLYVTQWIDFPILQTVIHADSFQKLLFYLLVAGNANFKMPRTCLTLCGMTQPATAAPLIVDKSNVDKGLASRFLWIFPKPVFKPFSALEVSANEQLKEDAENFTRHLGNIFHKYLIILY